MSRYRAKPGLRIPMPGCPGQFVPEVGDGIQIDEQSSYFVRLIADGDLVAVTEEPPAKPGKAEGKN